MISEIHVPDYLPLVEEHEVPIELEDGLVQQLLWMLKRRE